MASAVVLLQILYVHFMKVVFSHHLVARELHHTSQQCYEPIIKPHSSSISLPYLH